MPSLGKAWAAARGDRLSRADVAVLAASIVLLAAMVRVDGGPGYGAPPDFAALSVEDKKREFFAYLSPFISSVNFDLAAARDRVARLRADYTRGERPGWFDRRWLERLAYRLEVDIDELGLEEALAVMERRAGVVPESIVLVQAAIESGWGTSRFAREGNNYFGQRCYRADCGMRARGVTDSARFGLARFASVAASVESYMLNLNTHPEYAAFRRLRERLRVRGEPVTGLALVPGLSGYSERGEAYVAEIAGMIRANGLE